MGAMTMTASNEAVKWILSSMVSMCPEAETTVKGTMSDLGELKVYILLFPLYTLQAGYLMESNFPIYLRCHGGACERGATKC